MKRSLLVMLGGGLLLILGWGPEVVAKTAKTVKSKADLVSAFNLTAKPNLSPVWTDELQPSQVFPVPPQRTPVGAASSVEAGIGIGEPFANTYEDMQQLFPLGRRVATYWNGLAGGSEEVSVHFGYELAPNLVNPPYPNAWSGYLGYDAVTTSWSSVCGLQSGFAVGDESGRWVNLDLLEDGRVVFGTNTQLDHTVPSGDDNLFYYQFSPFSCFYSLGTHTSYIDPSIYRPNHIDQASTTYSRDVQIATQWDGANVITHVLMTETEETGLTGPDYVDDPNVFYRAFTHYYRVGSTGGNAGWSAGTVIDSLTFPSASLVASPVSGEVSVVYTNPGYWCNLTDAWEGSDRDVFVRTSTNYGLNWNPKYSITNNQNAINGHPNHFTAKYECQGLYTWDDNLHVVWTAAPTSVNPYFDGFDWNGFDGNIYHWNRLSNDIVEVANATFLDANMLTGGIAAAACGFGGPNAGYIASVNISECDSRLYVVWNQIHERATHGNWNTNPTLLDDCAYYGDPAGMANWQIMMSVSSSSLGVLWDQPRNVSNTYTPACGLPGDPQALSLCASEYKPSVEKYGLNEAGLNLSWPPSSVVDISPQGNYSGDSYLNMEYTDDQFPGSSWRQYIHGGGGNNVSTLNSMKWIRLACVEPVAAPLISCDHTILECPHWVPAGGFEVFPITVINKGNIPLDVYEIGYAEDSGPPGWLGVSSSSLVISAGVVNSAMFDIQIDASAVTGTEMLDGLVWLKSDAANSDSLAIEIHILATASVEPFVWDTVQSHPAMYDLFGVTVGECVGLAVGNNGEIGLAGEGSVNLDFGESGYECGTRPEDSIYLYSGSPFVLDADGAGTNVALTCSYEQAQLNACATTHGWKPVPDLGSITGGLESGGAYDSVYTGRMVNRDTTIALERIFYSTQASTGPMRGYVVTRTKIYSADGQSHDNLALGSVSDWDVPSGVANNNTSGLTSPGAPNDFTYMQGTDQPGNPGCQLNTDRYATEAFLGWYTHAEWLANPTVNHPDPYGNTAFDQSLLENQPTVGGEPDAQQWWDDLGANPGYLADPAEKDQAIWLTYLHDYDLAAADTLYFWSVYGTRRTYPKKAAPESLADLEDLIEEAHTWYNDFRGIGAGECYGTGDMNGSGGYPTFGDLATLADLLYVTQDPNAVVDLAAGDVNADCVLDTFDIVDLQDMIFGSGPPPGYPLPTCCDPYIDYDSRTGSSSSAPLGNATVEHIGDDIVVTNVGSSGDDGVRITPPAGITSDGLQLEGDNIDLSTEGAGITISYSGLVNAGGKSLELDPVMQEVGMIGVTTVGGLVQITGDFNPIGDPEVFIQTYIGGGVPGGSHTVTGGGIVAWGNPAMFGLPKVIDISIYGYDPPAFNIVFDRMMSFTMATDPPVVIDGNEIRLLALNATGSIEGLGPSEFRGSYIGWFGLRSLKDDVCCRGFTGNANMDNTDAATIGDIATLIDNLFITRDPLDCLGEADVNQSGTLIEPPLDPDDITIGDVADLVDHLFINKDPLEICP